jgi:hypothetical protein
MLNTEGECMPLGTPKRQSAEAVQKAIIVLCPTMSFSDPQPGSQQRIANELETLTNQINRGALETLRRLLTAVHAANEQQVGR